MVEAEFMDPTDVYASGTSFQFGGAGAAPGGATGLVKGSEGLFAAIEARGNVYAGFAGAAAPGSGLSLIHI